MFASFKGQQPHTQSMPTNGTEKPAAIAVLPANGTDLPKRGFSFRRSNSAERALVSKEAAVSKKMYKAMKGTGIDEAAINEAAADVKSQAEWYTVQSDFALRHNDMCKGDLVAALQSELGAEGQQKLTDVGRGNGVDIWSKKPMVILVPIPDGKKPGDNIGELTTPQEQHFTASVPNKLEPGQSCFHVLVNPNMNGTSVQVAKPLASVNAQPIEGKVSVVQLSIPAGSEKGAILGPYKAPSGKEFTVKVPKSKKPGDPLMVIIDETVKKGEEQVARPLEKDQVVQVVLVPKGKKEGDFINMVLTPSSKGDFPAYVPKGSEAGQKVAFVVDEVKDSSDSFFRCFSGLKK